MKTVYWYEKATEQGNTDAESMLANAQLKLKASGGDAAAQAELGWMYYDGDGVSKDLEKALYWFEKSAEKWKCRGSVYLVIFTIMEMEFQRILRKHFIGIRKWRSEDFRRLRIC